MRNIYDNLDLLYNNTKIILDYELMAVKRQQDPRRVLIVSSHPLFGMGIRHLLETRQEERVEVIGIVSTVEQAIRSLRDYQPDLVVVDYDDGAVNRDEFLARFVESEHKLRVVLLSLKEGGSHAIVYDRRSLASSAIDEWLQEWTSSSRKGRKPRQRSINQSMKAHDKHPIGVLFFIVIFTILGLMVLQNDLLLPEPASNQALPIDWLFTLQFRATAVLFAVIIGAILYSVIFFRRKPGDSEDPVYQKGDRSLNITWVVIPVGALFAFVALSVTPGFENLFTRILPRNGMSFEWVATFLAVLFGLLLYFILFGIRSGRLTQEENAKENIKLELAWIGLPLGLVLLLAFAGSDALAQTLRQDPKPLIVNVVAKQWSWQFEYPGQEVISNELVLPVNKQVLLKLSSVDVLHSFWVPEFRVKQDLVPGEEKELRITPTKVGSYTLMCAEICGTKHAYMNAPVIVKSVVEFEDWLASQQMPISADPVERGRIWYTKFGCNSCHSVDGTALVGPTLKGLFGKQEVMRDGSIVLVDEQYLIEAIRQPGKLIVKDFSNIMPAADANRITDEQLADMIEFIKTLR